MNRERARSRHVIPEHAHDALALASACPFPLAILDTRGRVVLANRGAGTLLALLRDAIEDPGARRRIVAALAGALAGDVDETLIDDSPGRAGPRAVAVVRRLGARDEAPAGALLAIVSGAIRAPFAARAAALAHALDDAVAVRDEAIRERRDVADAMPDMLVTLDARARITDVNLAVRRETGFPASALIGRSAFEFFDTSIRRRLTAAAAALADFGVIDEIALCLPRRDGSSLSVTARAEARFDEAGSVCGARVTLVEAKRPHERRQRLLAADRLAVAGRLAAGIAHGINNPLQAILMHLAVLDGSLPDDETARDSWERVKDGVRRIQRVVGELRNLDAEPGGDSRGSCDANAVVRNALSLAMKPLRVRGIDVSLDVADALPRIALDPRQVHQVVLGLLLHAVGVLADGARLRVRTRAVAGGFRVAIDVQEIGEGLESNELAGLVDPFDSRGTSGDGFGLYAAWRLVEEAGGELTVETFAGRGTRLRVVLPCVVARRGPIPDDASAETRSERVR